MFLKVTEIGLDRNVLDCKKKNHSELWMMALNKSPKALVMVSAQPLTRYLASHV